MGPTVVSGEMASGPTSWKPRDKMLEEVRALCLKPEIEKQRILTVMIEILDVCLRNSSGWLYPILHAHETKKTRRNNCSMSGRLVEVVR